MWFKLNLDGIIFKLKILNYLPSSTENWDSQWCKIDLSITSGNWLKYIINNDELLLASEVETLSDNLRKLLNDELYETTQIECIEPDFKFILYPKKDLRSDPKYIYVQEGYEIEDISMEWIVFLWNGGLTNNYLSMAFDRNDIEYLYYYLEMIMGRMDKQSKTITEMINKGIIML
ncbi:MAG: hypothetical protein LOD89_04375 [Tissierellales bacterium]